MTESGQDPAGSSNVTRRRFVAGTAAGAGALYLAACGGGNDKKAASATTTSTKKALTGPAKRGGTFRIGVAGGGTSENLNPTNGVSNADFARTRSIFEPLVQISPKDGSLENVLLEDMTSNADFTKWTLKLIDNATWHDGKPFTADDVIYTIGSALQKKKFIVYSASSFAGIKLNSLRKLDDHTLTLELETPNSLLRSQFSDAYCQIFQNGETQFKKPAGTGPFKVQSFTPGERCVLAAFDEYRGGRPNLDRVEVISIDDPGARLNAVLGGQVDAIADPAFAQLPRVESDSRFQIVENPGSTIPGSVMQTTAAKNGKSLVNDNNVRLALKHLVDRQQIVDVAWGGHARIGNDLNSPGIAEYAKDIPQRDHDPEKAQSLLKKAGLSGADLAKITQVTADVYANMNQQATLIVSSANKGGADLKLKKVSPDTYWSNSYMQTPMFVTYWLGRRTLQSLWRFSATSNSENNESNFHDPTFDKVYHDLVSTKDEGAQKRLYEEGQRILWERGGQLYPALPNYVVVASEKVRNIPQSELEQFGGWDYRGVSLA